jgi:hypothetical protein
MSNKINDETLQRLYDDVVADDEAGLIDDVISNIAYLYGLHEDDDRDEILQKNFMSNLHRRVSR